MGKRAVSSISLWTLVAVAVGFGGTVGGLLLLLFLSAAGQVELILLQQQPQEGADKAFRCSTVVEMVAAVGLGTGLLVTAFAFGFGGESPLLWGVAVVAITAVAIDAFRHRAGFARWTVTTASGYIAGLLLFFPLILRDHNSLGLVIWTVAVVKFNDAGALVGGRLIGRIKLAPVLSPGKTIEGALLGIGTGCMVGWFLWPAISTELGSKLNQFEGLAIAAILGPVSVASDLFESWMKRRGGAKDSGSAIPGIGGVLDLIDSLLFAAPTAWLLFRLFAIS